MALHSQRGALCFLRNYMFSSVFEVLLFVSTCGQKKTNCAQNLIMTDDPEKTK